MSNYNGARLMRSVATTCRLKTSENEEAQAAIQPLHKKCRTIDAKLAKLPDSTEELVRCNHTMIVRHSCFQLTARLL